MKKHISFLPMNWNENEFILPEGVYEVYTLPIVLGRNWTGDNLVGGMQLFQKFSFLKNNMLKYGAKEISDGKSTELVFTDFGLFTKYKINLKKQFEKAGYSVNLDYEKRKFR